MRRVLSRLLLGLSLFSSAAMVALLAGFWPVIEPDVPKPEPLRIEAKPPRPASTSRVPVPVEPLPVDAFDLCPAPAAGARLEATSLPGMPLAVFVWCEGGYQLFGIERSADGRAMDNRVTRVARFPTRAALPGGALAADVTADGVTDFVIGVAPAPGVIHAPGSGAFLVRGRAEGGFEAARALLEMPVVAVESATFSDQARDILLLTRGDVAAQRPGELIWLRGGASPVKTRALETGLDPRGLSLAHLNDDVLLDVAVAVSQPGRVLGFMTGLDGAEPTRTELPLADATELLARTGGLLVRTTHDLFAVRPGATPTLEPVQREVNLGPSALSDLDGDDALDVLAVTSSGIAWLRAKGPEQGRDLALPEGLRALDVVVGSDALGPRGLVAVAPAVQGGTLSLLLLPALPWPATQHIVPQTGAVRDAPSVVEAPLR